MKKLLITIAMLPIMSFAGQDGSGGGGICINNKCKTLAEAGFRPISDNSTVIGSDVVEELRYIESILPNVGIFESSWVIGKPGDVEFVSYANPEIVQKFLAEYRKVLNNNNGQEYSKNMEIFGFTVEASTTSKEYTEPRTFIITDKYSKLSKRGKALLLIHEFSLRKDGMKLQEALARDGALVDYLKAFENNNWENFDTIYFLYAALGKYRYTTRHLAAELIDKVGLNEGQNILTSVGPSNFEHTARVKLDYAKILENNKYYPNFSTYAKETIFDLTTHGQSRGDLIVGYFLETEGNAIESKNKKTIVYSNKGLQNYLQKLDVNLKNVLELCGNQYDSRFLVYNKKVSPAFNELKVAECRYPNGNYGLGRATALKYLNGLQFDVPGKIVCTKRNIDIDMQCHLEQ